MSKLIGSQTEYSLFYRSRRVFRQNSEWYFEDDKGKSFGPFDKRDQVLEAVKVYQQARGMSSEALLSVKKKLG